MKLTLILTALDCVILFLAIWAATITLPFKALAGYFPKDVQKRLEPRIAAAIISTRTAMS